MSVERSELNVERSAPRGAVFLSYAREDAAAARRIAEALRASGIEVWFDEDELRGGDAWDAKIRQQIRECALFVPVISANTQARAEGYFRREWRMAAERMRDMADDAPFLVPVVIDDTEDARARVPDCFRDRQWTRLPGGATSHPFCARVQALLGGFGLEPGRPRPAKRDEGIAPAGPSKQSGSRVPSIRRATRPARLLIVGAMAACMVGAAFWWLGRTPFAEKKSPQDNATASAAPVSASETPAGKLIAQAWEQMNRPELYRAELEIADDLCRRATSLDPDNADAWATWSHVDSWQLYYGIDATDSRREAARTKAARASKLDPASFEARFAELNFLVRGTIGSRSRATPENAERIAAQLRSLVAERPGDARVQFTLAILLRNMGNVAESAAMFDRMSSSAGFAATAKCEKAWLYWINRDYAAAQADCDQSFTLQPFRSNLLLRLFLALAWSGDLDLAKATLAQVPPQMLLEDDLGMVAVRVYWWRREPAQLRQVLNAIPRSWFMNGAAPKAYYVGESHRLGADEEAAQASWREALRETERQAEKAPGVRISMRKARLLALLGRGDEARQILRLAQAAGLPTETSTATEFRDWAIYLSLGDKEAALDALERSYDATIWTATWAMLRYNPLLDPLRDHPRFQALLARAEADPQRNPHAKAAAAPVQPATNTKSIAVLPFENRSTEKDNEYFSDGVSDEILNLLGKVPGLRVAGRASSFAFKGRNVSDAEIARTLGVTYVVNGSVQKVGSQVRIMASLGHAADGTQIWSESFTKELTDILAVQDEIAGFVAQALQLKLGAARPARRVNPEAYRLALEGRHFWQGRTPDGFTRAEAAFQRALAIDPDFPDAHAGLAAVWAVRGWYAAVDGADSAAEFARARAAAQAALRLDPAMLEAHAVLGAIQFNEDRFAEAEQSFQTVLKQNPNHALVLHWRAHLLGAKGQVDESCASLELSAQLDPLSFITLVIYALHLEAAGRDEEALAVCDRANALRPELFVPLHATRAFLLWKLGRTTAAVDEARRVARDPLAKPRWWQDSLVVHILRQSGQGEEADAHATRFLASQPEYSRVRSTMLFGMGRTEEGLAVLEKFPPTMSSRLILYGSALGADARKHPRFADVMARIGWSREYAVFQAARTRMTKRNTEAAK